jgi:hypothetical protein
MANYYKQYLEACKSGQLEEAKLLLQDYQVDVHIHNGLAFQSACGNGHIEITKWLVQDHQVDIHANYDSAIEFAYGNYHFQIINWFVKEFRYTELPYYYYNRTIYILNHEQLSDWGSCTILGCPILYIGELDEPAVIAFIATLRRPKSARS